MHFVDEKLAELGFVLPTPSVPPGDFVAAKVIGREVYVSGQVPLKDGVALMTGHLGDNISLEDGQLCAQWALLNALAHVKKVAGDWDNIETFIRIGGFVAATADFTKQPAVIDGASSLLQTLFGERGQHVRAAVGVVSLPRGVPVEIELSVLLNA